MSEDPLHVAIIGGGLCGLALAIALTKRKISYTIYEARGSFTEIGAGLNLGPNSIHSFSAIDPALSDKIFALATRNEPGKEDIWMNLRFGAPTDNFEDAHFITGIRAPPTGNMTLSRNELLQLLANSIPPERVKFNKKIAEIQQSSDGVTMTFADGTQEKASVVIGCDGAHSTVRRLILGLSHSAAMPKFSQTGGYRAVFPMHVHEQAVGADKAHSSHIFCGPGGYVITYPIDGGKNVNIGLWQRKDGDWKDSTWVLHHQKPQMLKDFAAWGPTIQRLMGMMSDETQFWATFHHSEMPEHYFDGRVCLIGDAAHAMSPHHGQGAAQAMEDACVMAEVLQHIGSSRHERSQSNRIKTAFLGFEAARRKRFEGVLGFSLEGFDFWSDFLRPELAQEDIEEYEREAYRRFNWLWNEDIAGQGERAVSEMKLLLKRQTEVEMNGDVKLN